MNTEDAVRKIRAGNVDEVFGSNPDLVHKELVKKLHPDVGGSEEDFKVMQDGYLEAKLRIQKGIAGTSKVTKEVVIYGGGKKYNLEKVVTTQLFPTSKCYMFSEETLGNVLLQISKSKEGNKELDDEMKVVTTRPEGKEYPFLLLPLTSFSQKFSTSDVVSAVNVYPYPGRFHLLSSLQSEFIGCLDARTVAWMYRKTLATLISLEECRISCDQILKHLMINVYEHGIMYFGFTPSFIKVQDTIRTGVKEVSNEYLRYLTSEQRSKYPELSNYLRNVGKCDESRIPSASALLTEFTKVMDTTFGVRKWVDLKVKKEPDF